MFDSVTWANGCMYACFLKATRRSCRLQEDPAGYKKILAVWIQDSKLCIYTYLTYYSLRDNRRITEKLNKEKLERNVTHSFHPILKYNEAKIE